MNTGGDHLTETVFMDPGSPAFAGAGKSGMTIEEMTLMCADCLAPVR